MANYSYRTKGNTSPQGKERVYFTCHPSDFRDHFKLICKYIFASQNCAIWYRTELEEKKSDSVSDIEDVLTDAIDQSSHSEKLALDLGQMQLFVIPITELFLKEPNYARDVEFQFALDHHIPILPLMQESASEEDYQEVCKDLQFLDMRASSKDPTALSFAEKLEKYLSSVLLGDELADKVRAAFDAYIFLSYRKKDRKYAQELMKLIHQKPFCRDIAIWYDEFLTPGENFNNAIKEALEKSKVFAMVVTPNLVNETNYVMTTEYPEAVKKEMSILPAQMVETDKETLQKKYPGIQKDSVTNAYDEEALREALTCALEETLTEEKLQRIRGIALSEAESAEDPQHLFFIGLAYLSGIDVEVNTERATELIMRAANTGLEEAIEKLINMYRNGDGVEQDFEAAIQWQKKLTDIYRERYEKNQTEENGDKYFWKLMQYSECILEAMIQSQNKLEQCKKELEQIKKSEYYSEYRETHYYRKPVNNDEYRKREKVYKAAEQAKEEIDQVGKKMKENQIEAESVSKKMLDLAKKMVEQFAGTTASRDLAFAYDYFGKFCYEKNDDMQMACENYETAFRIRKRLVKKTGLVNDRRDLSFSYDHLGDVAPYRKKTMELLMELLIKVKRNRKKAQLLRQYI